MFRKKKKFDFSEIIVAINHILKDVEVDNKIKLSLVKTYIDCVLEEL